MLCGFRLCLLPSWGKNDALAKYELWNLHVVSNNCDRNELKKSIFAIENIEKGGFRVN